MKKTHRTTAFETTITRIPKEARLRRSQRFSLASAASASLGDNGADDADDDDAKEVRPTTRLHELCASGRLDTSTQASSWSENIQQEVENSPWSVFRLDSYGRLPLHILGDNVDLISTPWGKDVASKAALKLMRSFPEALTTLDDAGFAPFVSLIFDWEQWNYFESHLLHHHQNRQHHQGGAFSSFSSSSPSAKVSEILGRVASAVTRSTDGRSTDGSIERSPSAEEDAPMMGSQGARTSSTTIGATASTRPFSSNTSASTSDNNTNTIRTTHLFPRVELWDEVVWCFEMLSLAVDELGGKNGGLYENIIESHSAETEEQDMTMTMMMTMNNKRDSEARTLMAKHLPQVMPCIVKTILLVNGGGSGDITRMHLLQSSIFRAILLQQESVGDWLTAMIRKGGMYSRLAIDYLALVSETKIADFTGGFRPYTAADKEAFHVARLEVFNAIDALEGTIASLVILGDHEIERAASTSVIWFIMSKNLARPFVVSVTLIDFVFQIVLLMAYRTEVSASSTDSEGRDAAKYMVFLICVQYLIRKVCESIALFTLSVKVFRSYMLNLWNLFDLFSVVMVLAVYSWNQAHPNTYRTGLNTFLLGLLWLKVLAFLKVVNQDMSTFILSLFRILKDLLYFSFVLFVVIVMFADMFKIAITTENDGTFCEELYNSSGNDDDGPAQDFCNPSFLYSILRTYALLLGDFSLDDYTKSTEAIVLFVIFTAVGVIILLNVLIAVISDSYEAAKLNSHRLFGRARVGFVAQNQALESILRPGANPIAEWHIQSPTRALVLGLSVLRWLVLASLVATATYADFFVIKYVVVPILNGRGILLLLCVLAVVVALSGALWILYHFVIGGVLISFAPGFIGRVVRAFDRWTFAFSTSIASRLFGTSKSERLSSPAVDEDEGEDNWQGKMAYMEKAFDRTANRIRDEMSAELTAEMDKLKAEIADLRSCLLDHEFTRQDT